MSKTEQCVCCAGPGPCLTVDRNQGKIPGAAREEELAADRDAQKQPLEQSESRALSWMNRALNAESERDAAVHEAARLRAVLEKIAKPALGGKQQQWMAQEALKAKP